MNSGLEKIPEFLSEKGDFCDSNYRYVRQAEKQLALTVQQMQEVEGVTEALKAADQLEWVRRMNSIRNRAEEIIKTELIFV